VIVVLTIIAPTFRGDAAIYATLERFLLLGIATAGIAVTMIAGELDLSVGSTAVLSGVIAIQLSPWGLIPSVAVATLCGAVLGAAQGWVIARTGINSLVLTVGTLILFRGAAWIAANGAPISVKDFDITDPLLLRVWVVSPLSATAIVVLVVIGVFLAWSKWGREIVAIGGARTEALAAGVPLRRPMVIAFAISGTCGALAGALSSMKGGSVTPDSYSDLVLSCVAAALIGGISLYGGRGDMINIALGILIIAVLTSGLSALGMQSFVSELITGTLLLAVIVIDYVIGRISARRKLMRLQRRDPDRQRPAGDITTTGVGAA
jgi:ribose transport system permease protein